MSEPSRILVIKLGALGDFIQAFGPFAAIRAHHPDARITLLTTRPFADLAKASPYFDEVWIDSKPKLWQVTAWQKLKRQLKSGRFDMVYDLQTSDRSGWYYKLVGIPQWSGIASGCLYPHDNPDRDHMHTVDRQAEQLAMAGVPRVPPPDLYWMESDISRFPLPLRPVLMIPGGAPHRPAKRWPAEKYGMLCNRLVGQGLGPVLLGTEKEAEQLDDIAELCPEAVNLAGRTSFFDIASLGRRAVAAVGNDTGPMHLIAAAGCPSVVLFSAESNPTLCAPRGRVRILQRPHLNDLPVEEVEETLLALTRG